MDLVDDTSLFLHVLAAIGIVGGGLVQILAGVQLRAAATGRDVAMWARFARGAGLLIVSSAAVSLLTGGHLAGAVWGKAAGGFANPFITLGLAGLLVLAPIGPMVGGARLGRLIDAAGAADGPAPTDLLVQARHPGLWGPVHSLVGVGVGLVALMVYKPTWAVGGALLLATFAAGWVAGVLVSGRSPRTSTAAA